MLERLDKLISETAGVSRKDAKKIILSGEVFVNGLKCTLPKAKFAKGSVLYIGGEEKRHRPFVYIMVNKPKGLLCVSRDKTRETVTDLVKKEYPHRKLFPAGRLDKDSEGFVLLTDDGSFAHGILSPKNHIPKTYMVTIDKPFTKRMREMFLQGVVLADGTKTMPAIFNETENPFVCEAILKEGKYHQIKRMLGVAGVGVNRLVRVGMGGLILDAVLQAGEYREIAEKELEKITNGSS